MSLGTFTCLLEVNTRQMSVDESEFMIRLSAEEKKRGDMPVDLHKQLRASPVFKIIESRLEPTGADVSSWLVAFVDSLCEGNPGKAVMWAWTLAYIATKCQGKVDFDEFARYFPMGVPVEDEYRRVWYSQKERGRPLGNCLDDPDFWPKVA